MLAIRGDGVVALVEEPIDGNIQRLGGIGRKGHMICPRTSKKPGQLLPGVKYRPGCLQRAAMGAPGGVTHGRHGVKHRLRHLGRLMDGCGSVIQINHGPHSP